jgi:hypothetical protein
MRLYKRRKTRRHRRKYSRRNFRWIWGKKTKKVGKKTYKLRILMRRKGKKWVKTKRSYMRLVRGPRRVRRSHRSFQWRWGKKTKKVKRGKKTALYRRRILFKKSGGKWRPTRRAYWRLVRKNKTCRWRWGRAVRKIKGRKYRKRVLRCVVKGKWATRKSYWRLVRHYRRKVYRRRYAWRWGKKTKRKGGSVYRIRRLYRKGKHGRWYGTKRAYWRKVKHARRYKSRKTRRKTRRYVHRRAHHYRWRWGSKTKTMKKKKYRMRILFSKKKGKWVATKRFYWRALTRRKRIHKRSSFRWRWGKATKKRGGVAFRRRILFKKSAGKWRPTKRSYWRRVTKKGCVWKWGKAMRKRGALRYRRRVQFCKNKKTGRKYWKRIRSLRRKRYSGNRSKWFWGMRTKTRRKQLYRMRILKTKVRKIWRPTKRSYYRKCGKKCKAQLIRMRAYYRKRQWKAKYCKTTCKTVGKGKKAKKSCKTVCKKVVKKGKKGKKVKKAAKKTKKR